MQGSALRASILLIFSLSFFSAQASAEFYEFDSCGSIGPFGPGVGDCDYESTEVDIVGEGIQVWEVPEDGEYRIKALGAQGSASNMDNSPHPRRSYGAVIEANMSLEAGDKLRILVGQEIRFPETAYDDRYAPGGGGTFVTKETKDGDEMFDGQNVEPLIIAGGGGGVSTYGGNHEHSEPHDDYDGRTRTWGGEDHPDNSGNLGGFNGEGGDSPNGYGGAGYLEDGEGGWSSSDSDGPGQAFIHGGVGGGSDSFSDSSTCSSEGAFGGSGSDNCEIGGGGGYSGGSGSGSTRISGGGGSFIYAGVQEAATSDGNWETTGNEPHEVYQNEVRELGEWNNEGSGEVIIERIDTDFCDFRGPQNECVMNETNQLQEQEYNVSSVFESRSNAVFEAFQGPAVLSLENTTSISGLWKGGIQVNAESPRIQAGAEFRPEGERIIIGD